MIKLVEMENTIKGDKKYRVFVFSFWNFGNSSERLAKRKTSSNQKKRTKSQGSLQQRVEVYNCLLDACIECKALPRALDVFEEMKEQSLADVVSYNTLMKGGCEGWENLPTKMWFMVSLGYPRWAVGIATTLLFTYVVLLCTSLSYLDWGSGSSYLWKTPSFS